MNVSKLLETRPPVCGLLQGRRAPARANHSRLVVIAGVQQNGLGLERSSASFVRQDLLIPSQLIDCKDNQRQQTVYTVRFTTAFARGSGLDEPYAGVQLCLIGADGSSVLHRVSPLFDPAALQAELASINAVVDTSVGANQSAIAEATSRIETLPAGKQRFQACSVDEISFLGPELGPLKSLLIAPEKGSWRLEEVTVSSSRSRHTDRFVCGDLLGAKGGTGYLSAVPPDAVVYGSGHSVVLLTRAQARALHEAGMGRYSLFKERLLQANLSLVSIGTGLAWTFAGDDIAINFAAGGASGLLYQWLLQKGVDGISLSTSPLYKKAAGYVAGESVGRIVSSGAFQVALVGATVFCAIYGSRAQDPTSAVHFHPNTIQQILIGACGFFMFKLALIGVLTVPPVWKWSDTEQP